ncbi:MAG: hypothetical protein ACOX2U_03410 [Limisphaerales bacterium]|jgi:hypothetical protein|nr:hypothetical protein [Verrucomicrobiota bacterium]
MKFCFEEGSPTVQNKQASSISFAEKRSTLLFGEKNGTDKHN